MVNKRFRFGQSTQEVSCWEGPCKIKCHGHPFLLPWPLEVWLIDMGVKLESLYPCLGLALNRSDWKPPFVARQTFPYFETSPLGSVVDDSLRWERARGDSLGS